ncbi:MAG: SIMPL domain-containing protein [Prolixibacteraceae bacterium]|jgi:uncharacterized protein YggE|nr:SIMPL domain-containing protein [Prolixibacteraceae bacterium]
MKISLPFIFTLLCYSSFLSAQIKVTNDQRIVPIITVSEKAKVEIEPKSVILSINLNIDSQKKDAVPLKELESQLYQALKDNHFSRKNLELSNVSKSIQKKKRKSVGFYSEHSYKMKISDFNNFQGLLTDLNKIPYLDFSLDKFDYGDISMIKDSISAVAASNAKRKSIYVSKALDYKTYRILDINVDNGEYINASALLIEQNYRFNDIIAPAPPVPGTNNSVCFQKMTIYSNVTLKIEVKPAK